jgi:hypothetical protein
MASAPVGFKIGDAWKFAATHGLKAEAEKIKTMQIDPRIGGKRHGPKKGCLVELFESQGLMDEFVAQYWPARHTTLGEQRRQSYLDKKALNEQLLRGEPPDEDALDDAPNGSAIDQTNDTDPVAFALEGQLRDFIVANLSQIRISGSRLRLYTDSSGRDGVEYPTDVGQIDILTVDETGRFFVFELKLDRGPDRALGQLARYMGWIKVRLADNKEVRGVVVARSIDEKLRYGVCVMPNVSLLEYEVNFRLRDVESISPVPNSSA